jgi:hypothetical protein
MVTFMRYQVKNDDDCENVIDFIIIIIIVVVYQIYMRGGEWKNISCELCNKYMKTLQISLKKT